MREAALARSRTEGGTRAAGWLRGLNAVLAVAWLGMVAAHLWPVMEPAAAITGAGMAAAGGSATGPAGAPPDGTPAGAPPEHSAGTPGRARGAAPAAQLPPAGRLAWPLPVPAGVTSPFGPRGSGWHHGVDLAAPAGTPVLAVWDGVVRQAGWRGVYGLTVEVEHPGGWRSLYGHLSELAVVAGQRVGRGAMLGRVGDTGNATGPHLHLEVRTANGFHDPLKGLARPAQGGARRPHEADGPAVQGGP